MSDFTYIQSGSNAIITGYTGAGGNIIIPLSVVIARQTLPVIAIDDNAFFNNLLITGV